ncbi:MAG: 50S ribosomal protein L13 [Nanoarchaeota archaeon]
MSEKTIIDATGAIFGRLCSFAAKKALEGDDVIIINSERTVITGNKKNIIEEYGEIRKKGGHSLKGPKYSRVPYKMLKRGIRGMLPDFRRGIGKQAFKGVKCYNGIPKELENEKIIKMPILKKVKYIGLEELSGLI